ncbi:hypothetical protein [Budvicia diplopodorum]|uniref:hypothetical protein n=1 Tax=Budvicia diplopodorum TaxID=1119056 RepID=UPI00135958FA|nr:hypothetical protein [Budvicia diplopodorum]
MTKKVLLLGATGLIGGQLLAMLESDPYITHIYAPTRKPLLSTSEKLINPIGPDVQILLDTLTEPVDIAFCCLGTTLKEAGSREAFRFADMVLPVHGGKTALRLGAAQYLVVSAIGAKASSWIFYNQTKGRMEQALIAQNWPHLALLRPSMLIGHRENPRQIEQITAPLFRLLPGRWKGIASKDVAYVMWKMAVDPLTNSLTILQSDQIRRRAARGLD